MQASALISFHQLIVSGVSTENRRQYVIDVNGAFTGANIYTIAGNVKAYKSRISAIYLIFDFDIF